MQTSIAAINKTVEKTNEWLTELAQKEPFQTKEQAYSLLRAVLHTLRDNLIVDQATKFIAQFPLLLQGVYYEGWDPSVSPSKERTKAAFLQHIRHEIRDVENNLELEQAVKATLQLLSSKLSPDTVDKIKQLLTKEVRVLWPDT